MTARPFAIQEDSHVNIRFPTFDQEPSGLGQA